MYCGCESCPADQLLRAAELADISNLSDQNGTDGKTDAGNAHENGKIGLVVPEFTVNPCCIPGNLPVEKPDRLKRSLNDVHVTSLKFPQMARSRSVDFF
jgi:hypothetical protein